MYIHTMGPHGFANVGFFWAQFGPILGPLGPISPAAAAAAASAAAVAVAIAAAAAVVDGWLGRT